MSRETRKNCNLSLHDVRRHFPSEEFACAGCSCCPLLRNKDVTFYCGWLDPERGKKTHQHKPLARVTRVAILLDDQEVHDTTIRAGAELTVERQQNAGDYLWVRVRDTCYSRRGKFLVHKRYLNLDGTLVKVHQNKSVQKITGGAVLIDRIWFPLQEVRLVLCADGQEIPASELVVGSQVVYVEIPEWLAQLKGLC